MIFYQKLEHTADVRILAGGENLKELFLACLSAMNEIINRKEARQKDNLDILKEINIESVGRTELLIDFLSEVLSLSHEQKAIFPKVKFKVLNDTNLESVIYGKKIEQFEEDIKAVTYHEAEIKKNEKGELETVLVFDI